MIEVLYKNGKKNTKNTFQDTKQECTVYMDAYVKIFKFLLSDGSTRK